jgi:uncharacterized protein involved in response to NO
MFGAVLSILWRNVYVHALHITLIGGFSLLSILVATRVTLSHSTEGKAPEKSWRSIGIFTGLFLLAAITRVIAVFWPTVYLSHLSYAAILWLIGIFIWIALMIPRMLEVFRND